MNFEAHFSGLFFGSLLLYLMNFVNMSDEIFVKIATFLNFAILENESVTDSKMNQQKKDFLVLFSHKKYRREIRNNSKIRSEDPEINSG